MFQTTNQVYFASISVTRRSVDRPGELDDTVVGDQAIHFLGLGRISSEPGSLDELQVEPATRKIIGKQ